jgi:hypothetical protein
LSLTTEWINAEAGQLRLSWQKPAWNQAGGETLLRYAVYRVPSGSVLLKPDGSVSALTDASQMIAFVGGTSFVDVIPAGTEPFNYIVTAVSRNSVESDPSAPLYVAPTSVDFTGDQPSQISLSQNYPNPFNPSTVIRFNLPVAGQVRLVVVDVTGRHVATLVDAVVASGEHFVSFDGSELTSGVYLYRLEAGGQLFTQKMLLLK